MSNIYRELFNYTIYCTDERYILLERHLHSDLIFGSTNFLSFYWPNESMYICILSLYIHLEHCWGSGSHADDIYINEHSLVLLSLAMANKPPFLPPHISSFSLSLSHSLIWSQTESTVSVMCRNGRVQLHTGSTLQQGWQRRPHHFAYAWAHNASQYSDRQWNMHTNKNQNVNDVAAKQMETTSHNAKFEHNIYANICEPILPHFTATRHLRRKHCSVQRKTNACAVRAHSALCLIR